MRRVPATTFMLVAMVLAAFVASAQSPLEEETREPGLQVDDQVTDGQTITISRAGFDRDGWITIHADDGGSPGDEIGRSESLAADLHVGVDIDVQIEETSGDTLRLHAVMGFDDDNATGNESGGDDKMTSSFTVHLGDAQAVVAAGPQELDGDEVEIPGLDEESEVEVDIDLVRMNVSGFLVIHLDNQGAPGMVVGQTDLLDAGEHTDVEVKMNRSDLPEDQDSFTVWAMLHLDDGDGEYAFPGPDGPITVDGTPVMTPVPTAWEDGFFDGLFEEDGGDDGDGGNGDGDDVAGEQPEDGDEGAPAPAFALIALALIGVVVFARRRQRT